MAECSKCGKQSMTFTCRYCGSKYCSEHRLPENHDCEKIDEVKKYSGDSTDSKDSKKWFKEQNLKEDKIRSRNKNPVKNSLFQDIIRSLKNNYTLAIIAVTVFSFFLQAFIPGYQDFLTLSPALTNNAVTAVNNAASQIFGQQITILTKTVFQAPWALLTVVLVHAGTFHLFANMVTFYFFGNTFEKTVGSRELLKLYLFSALGASLAYIGFRNLVYLVHGPILEGVLGASSTITMGPAVGASGAVVAIFGAVAMMYPKAEVLLYFFIPMKIQTALYLFAGLEIFNLITISAGLALPLIGGLASSAHLAGLVIGVWYGKKIRDKHNTRTGTLDLLGY